MDDQSGHLERGKIVGWPGGDAVIYPTLGFFGNAQIFAVGAVEPDGSFTIQLPTVVPVDVLGKSSDQCSTIQASDPEALSNFTGKYLISQHGRPIGATHSASSPGFAAFTSFHDGDTRTGLFYVDRDVTLTGSCERMLTFGAASIDFLQEFDISAHRGWNQVVRAADAGQAAPLPALLTTTGLLASAPGGPFGRIWRTAADPARHPLIGGGKAHDGHPAGWLHRQQAVR